MRILIVGGTRFVGRHITQAALAAGHEVSLLHRGLSGADLFPEATHLLADRNEDLSVLDGLAFDATIDVSAYLPGQVRALAPYQTGRYVFISTVGVYAAPKEPGYQEDSPLHAVEEPGPDELTEETYGPLKVLCERAAREHFGQSTLVVRPTYVIGPCDHSGRFTYWVHRMARGGEVLAPGPVDAAIQVIDARDQADWIVRMVQAGTAGVFHTACESLTFASMLQTIAATVAPAGTSLTWVDAEFLLANGEELPLWSQGNPDDALINTADPAAAIAAGLTIRPLAQSVREILALEPIPAGMSADREATLLAKWWDR